MRFHLFWLIIILTLNGCADKYEHNPNLAAKKAEEFATLAFVKQDFDGAYALLAESTQRHVSAAQFKQTLAKNQTAIRPAKVVAKEYEPMPGEKAIYVFLTGGNSSEQFSFRITMEGTADKGYKVLRFDPGSGFNLPGGQRKKL
jgi:hypothetical protein